MPREFTSQKAVRIHAELTGYVHLWEGTHAFTTDNGSSQRINTRSWMFARAAE